MIERLRLTLNIRRLYTSNSIDEHHVDEDNFLACINTTCYIFDPRENVTITKEIKRTPWWRFGKVKL